MTSEQSFESTECPHTRSTLVETRDLGTWQAVEVYACDACGEQRTVRLLHEAEDNGFAPEDPWGES